LLVTRRHAIASESCGRAIHTAAKQHNGGITTAVFCAKWFSTW